MNGDVMVRLKAKHLCKNDRQETVSATMNTCSYANCIIAMLNRMFSDVDIAKTLTLQV